MREAVVVTSSRTALAKAHRGSFNQTRPEDLAAHCIRELLQTTPQLDAAQIEDVMLGCGQPHGPQGHNIARIAALLAGLPTTVPGLTLNRFCSSGLQAIALAAYQVMHGGSDAIIAGGVESITMAPRDNAPHPALLASMPAAYMGMGHTAEVVARRYRISREAQDEYALVSQQRTARAQREGLFDQEIAPMQVQRATLNKAGEVTATEAVTAAKDECNRPDTTLEGLLALKPHFDPESGHGTVTAGNSSQLSDGASATLVMSRQRAEELGIPYKLLFRGFQVAGCDPDEMGIGPVFAVPRLLQRTGVAFRDVDLWELNEAFAVQVVYCRDRLAIDPEKLNVNGGSISIGHPFGMTGSRMVGTLANEMARRRARYGVVAMCVGGGQGAAALFERAG